MEQLNKIEIRGIIGSVSVKDFANAKVANFTVATNHTFTSKDGGLVIETTWHYVTAWEGKDIKNLSMLYKGAIVYVLGRLRNRKYTTPDGIERIAYEVIANKVELVKRDNQRV